MRIFCTCWYLKWFKLTRTEDPMFGFLLHVSLPVINKKKSIGENICRWSYLQIQALQAYKVHPLFYKADTAVHHKQ